MSPSSLNIATDILDILPNPVLVKNDKLEYVWINAAFENLFKVKRENVIGKLDTELFPDRQVSQCNGGDMRVLENGDIDEATETVFDSTGNTRETITRKSRLNIAKNEVYLVGVMHDITDVTRANDALMISESKLQEQAQKLAVLATTDMLTGCANRRALIELAPEYLENKFSETAVLLMDIDKFKAINDQLGHDAGDHALKHFANEVQKQLSSNQKMFRIGGEEFVLLLSGLNSVQAIAKANDIRNHIADTPTIHSEQEIAFTVSIGMAIKEKGESANIEELLQSADQCLYLAKNLGRNRVEIAA